MKNAGNVRSYETLNLNDFFLHNALHALFYASDPSDENFNCWFSCLLPPELTQSGKSGWSETLSHCHHPLPLRAEDKGSSVSIYLCVMQFVSHWSRCFWSLRLMTVTETQPRSYTSQEQPETDTIRLVRDEWFSFAGLALFFPPYHHCIYLLKEIKRFWKGHVLCFSVSI